MVYPTTPYLSLGSGLSRSINFGRHDGLSLMEILQVGPLQTLPEKVEAKA